MKIGFTYDLKEDYIKDGWNPEEAAEFDTNETVEGLENALKSLGFEVDKIGNARNLMKRLSNGDKWEIVFNICEGTKGFGRESLVPSLLDEFRIPYTFSDPLVLSICLHKGIAKQIVRSYGVPTSDYRIIKDKKSIKNIRLPYPLFAKPIAEGTGIGIYPYSKVNTFKELKALCEELLDKYNEPVLLERYLPGREFTIGIIGTGENAQAIGTMEVLFKEHIGENIYSYETKANYLEKVKYALAGGVLRDICEDVALRSWKALDCKDAGRVDIRLDANGNPNFIEVNPLAGLNLKHSDLPILSYLAGWTYEELIGKIIDSALERYGLKNERVLVKEYSNA